MAIYALTGNDTFTLNNRTFEDWADGSTIKISRPGELLGRQTGKNRNTIYATNEEGRNAEAELRFLLGGDGDAYFNGLLIQQKRDLPSFPLMNGTFSKRIGDGQGNVKFNNYSLEGGAFITDIEAEENLQGETEQGVAVYKIFFANAERAIM